MKDTPVTEQDGAEYWRGAYEALAARIKDPVVVQNSIQLTESALKMSLAFNKSFREVFTALLESVYRQRPRSRRNK